MKRMFIFFLCLVMSISFTGCNTVREQGTEGNDEQLILNAEEKFEEFLEYYDKDFSFVENQGLLEIEGYRYVVFEAIGFEGYSYYVSIDENFDIYGGYPNSEMDLVWSNGLPVDDEGNIDDTTPYVPISFNVLNMSFAGYQNQTGAYFYEGKHQDTLAPYYIRMTDDIQYYLGSTGNDILAVGVDSGEVCLLSSFGTSIVGYSAPDVREVINKLEVQELFEVQPAVAKINNINDSINFFYWKIENGYIGFGAIGGSNPANCYNYAMHCMVLFEDLSMINIQYS